MTNACGYHSCLECTTKRKFLVIASRQDLLTPRIITNDLTHPASCFLPEQQCFSTISITPISTQHCMFFCSSHLAISIQILPWFDFCCILKIERPKINIIALLVGFRSSIFYFSADSVPSSCSGRPLRKCVFLESNIVRDASSSHIPASHLERPKLNLFVPPQNLYLHRMADTIRCLPLVDEKVIFIVGVI